MLLGWFISGVCAGLNIMLASLYCNEVSPVDHRSVSGCIVNGASNLGVLVAYLMGYGIPYPYGGETNDFWRFMIVFPVIFIVIQLVLLFTVFTKETPKYYVQTNKDNEAKDVLSKIYMGNETLALEHYNMLVAERELDSHAVTVKLADLFSAKYRRRTTIGICLSILYQLTGCYVILTFSTPIFLGNNYTGAKIPSEALYDKALALTVLLGLLEFLASFPPAYFMDYVGRKAIMVWGFVGMALTYVVYEIHDTGVWGEGAVLVFIVILNFSIGTIMFVYLPEILPDVGVGLAWLVFWLIYTVFIFVYPVFVAATSIRAAFSVFLVGNVLGIIFTAIWVIETKDRTNDEIIEMYCPPEFWEHCPINKTSEEIQKLIDAEQ